MRDWKDADRHAITEALQLHSIRKLVDLHASCLLLDPPPEGLQEC